jgi:hypothetical protein
MGFHEINARAVTDAIAYMGQSFTFRGTVYRAIINELETDPDLDIGGNPIELVEPLGELAANLAHQPRTSPWLFTGHHRQPVNPKTISERLTRLGITRLSLVKGAGA